MFIFGGHDKAETLRFLSAKESDSISHYETGIGYEMPDQASIHYTKRLPLKHPSFNYRKFTSKTECIHSKFSMVSMAIDIIIDDFILPKGTAVSMFNKQELVQTRVIFKMIRSKSHS